MNRACFGGDSDWIDSETALPVLVSRCVVNQACFGVDTDGIGCETALPVLVSRYVVNRACLEVTVIGLIVKLLCQCLCWGA